jgi:hypothetical protein
MQARRAQEHHADFPALTGAPVESGRKRLAVFRQNWLSNTVFENYDAIVVACDAWRNLIAQPEQITSTEMRHWAHVGQPL